MVKNCTLRKKSRFADPEGAQFAVLKPGILSPVIIAGGSMCSHLSGERWARVSSDTAWPLWRIAATACLSKTWVLGLPPGLCEKS